MRVVCGVERVMKPPAGRPRYDATDRFCGSRILSRRVSRGHKARCAAGQMMAAFSSNPPARARRQFEFELDLILYGLDSELRRA